MKFKFEIGDVVTLTDITCHNADDFGLIDQQFDYLVDSEHNADEWIVDKIEVGDGLDVTITLADDETISYNLRESHLIPTPETLNNLLSEYGLDL